MAKNNFIKDTKGYYVAALIILSIFIVCYIFLSFINTATLCSNSYDCSQELEGERVMVWANTIPLLDDTNCRGLGGFPNVNNGYGLTSDVCFIKGGMLCNLIGGSSLDIEGSGYFFCEVK